MTRNSEQNNKLLVNHPMFSIYLLLKMQSNMTTIYGIRLGVDGDPERERTDERYFL
jgi:hypothetical protein